MRMQHDVQQHMSCWQLMPVRPDLVLIYIIDGVEGAGLVTWVGGPLDASFGFYLGEAFQSQTNTEKILYNKSR